MNFFKTFLASVLGVLATLFLLFLIVLIYASTQSSQPEPYVRANTVLKVSIEGNLPDRISLQPFQNIFSSDKKDRVSLVNLKENLDKAASHENIKGVWLQLSPITASWAQLQEARNYIKSFREKSDKFIYANTDDLGYNEKAYYLATAADSVFAPKETFFEFDGFYMQTMFMKGFYDKIGLDPEVVKKGKYKSAVEPLIQKEYSEENKFQMKELLNGVADVFLQAVSEKTGRSRQELDSILNDSPRFEIGFARDTGMIDSLLYPDKFNRVMLSRMGLEDDEELKTVNNKRYSRVTRSTAGLEEVDSENEIAVLHANGTILPREPMSFPPGGQSFITAGSIKEQLEEIREDDNVKALVLRINSPGGAGTTSDMIWQMIRNTSDDLPVISSMGSVAASGGYYIAMGSDSIVAEPTTITGSIGVFARQMNINELMTDKLDFSFDQVKTHEHADWLSPTRSWSKAEIQTMQNYVDEFYATFVSKVSESRGLSYDFVDERAQGRVWNGQDAEEEKLVDKLGGMADAVQLAAEKAELPEKNYKVEHYPKPTNMFEMFIESAQTKAGTWIQNILGFDNSTLQHMQEVSHSFNNRREWVNNMVIWPFEIDIQ